MKVSADLHIHSCLSPCGDLEMSPRAIVAAARKAGLDLIALTDHNSARNCPAFAEAAREINLPCFFGVEATTSEEAHCVCLFETVGQAVRFGELLYDSLPDIANRPDLFGDQVYVDDKENILGELEKSLLGASGFSVEKLMQKTRDYDGIFFPAHVDRPSFSLPSQLGFLPLLDYDAVETIKLPCPVKTHELPLIQNSDAHFIEHIGRRRTDYELDAPDFASLRRFLLNAKKDRNTKIANQ